MNIVKIDSGINAVKTKTVAIELVIKRIAFSTVPFGFPKAFVRNAVSNVPNKIFVRSGII